MIVKLLVPRAKFNDILFFLKKRKKDKKNKREKKKREKVKRGKKNEKTSMLNF